MNNSIVTSLMVALVVAGGLLAGGYLGFDRLRGELKRSGGESVIIELKTAAVDEIRAVRTEAVDEIRKMKAEIMAGLESVSAPPSAPSEPAPIFLELKEALDTVKSNQTVIVARLTALDERTLAVTRTAVAPARAPKPPSAPPIGDMASTIYFPLGVSKGPRVDAQLAKFLPGIKARSEQGGCRADVMGFSDTVGNDDANLRLSQKRADYVAGKLKSEGLAIGTIKGWGERWLKVHTYDGTENENNRRVVIDLKCQPPTA